MSHSAGRPLSRMPTGIDRLDNRHCGSGRVSQVRSDDASTPELLHYQCQRARSADAFARRCSGIVRINLGTVPTIKYVLV